MSIFVIGDLHLSFNNPKPMDIFGENWVNHEEKIKSNWIENVEENDLVVLPGDFSWETYLKDTKRYATLLAAQHNMGGFMKGILVKRLESSFYAFRMTLSRFIESYERFIDMYNRIGEVWISKKVDVYDLLDSGDIEKLMQMAVKENLSNDLKKCRWIHDRLVRNIVYGGKHVPNSSTISDAHTIEGVFLHKRAVCEGISKAFKLLSDRLGLQSIVAVGVAGMGDGGPHAWNISCLNGEFVQMDVTWDGNLSLACQHYRYDYFAITDLEIQSDHEYTEFLDYPICSTAKYSYFVQRNCLLSNPKQLEAFLDKEFRAKSTAIYFKIYGNIANKKKFSQKVIEMLYDFMCKYGMINVDFLDWSNQERMIFFYKQEKR